MHSFAKLTLLCLSLFPAIGLGAYPCQADAEYRKLDFWLGHWDAFDSARPTMKVGDNVIAKSENGCAITETWHEADGSGEAVGLFYYQPAGRQWKYVLVSASGAIKERVLTEERKDGAVRFQGEILQVNPPGSHLDRFTIIALAGGNVRETVEVSRDGGKTWQTTFDCEYRKRK
ncbi:MAG TPA: hypothetical protein VLJ84_04620 [Usitatibacter sp.]|nr:hypothetical protein [Usitatibacter sp.]